MYRHIKMHSRLIATHSSQATFMNGNPTFVIVLTHKIRKFKDYGFLKNILCMFIYLHILHHMTYLHYNAASKTATGIIFQKPNLFLAWLWVL